MSKTISIFILMMLIALGCSNDYQEIDKSHSPVPSVASTMPVKTESPSPSYQTDEATAPRLACFPEATASQVPVMQDSYEGFKLLEDECFSIYIPEDWESSKVLHSGYAFSKNKVIIGTSEVIGLTFSDTSSLKSYQPNHSEQQSSNALDSPPIENIKVNAYSIKLIYTKPAAETDPDWMERQTHLLISIEELERSFAFYFQADVVDDAVIERIAQSFRLK